MRSRVWLALPLAIALLASGCFSGSDSGTTERDRADSGADVVPRLPANLTLAEGVLIDRSHHQASWRWSDALAIDSGAPPSDAGPQKRTTLTLPPDTWLRVSAALTFDAPGVDLDLEITQADLILCEWDTPYGRLSHGPFELVADDTDACAARPDPSGTWRTWDFTVIARDWDPTAPDQAAFDVEVSVEAMRSAWSDVEPSSSPDDGWPEREEATIRPGAKIKDAGCTANFVFQGAGNASLYIGTAAHCVDGWGVGTLMGIAGIREAGRLAYCAWGLIETNSTAGCALAEESLANKLDNDFALLEIRPDLRHLVHPALLHWGGPTGLAGEVEPGDPVLMYGNSSYRDGFQGAVVGPVDPIEGHVVHPGFSEWETYLHVVGGVPGDSGSPVLTGTGLALGVVRSLELCDDGQTWQTVADLAPALDFLRERTGIEVELATWPLAREGVLSANPVHGEVEPLCDGGQEFSASFKMAA